MKYLVTGAAGFIGFHLSRALLTEGHEVRGFDGMTNYYDPALKQARLAHLLEHPAFSWRQGQLEERSDLDRAVEDFTPDVIVHLAAQAGVRYSIEQPATYINSNLVGTFNILEMARALRPRHLLFASTSSVYGANDALPFRETDSTRLPMSLYAATKTAGEAMSHSYAHLFGIPTTCFRFFTVYGPWGRPDMALFKFVRSIEEGESIDVYGEGKMSRDFTYIDDLVQAIKLLAEVIPAAGCAVDSASAIDTISPVAPWRVVNIAGGNSVGLMEFVSAVERHLSRGAIKNMLPMQPGDVPDTRADASLLRALTGFEPSTPVDRGVGEFVNWYRAYTRNRA